MCGIAGTLVFDDSDFRVDSRFLSQMSDRIALRGPDGAGMWIAPDGRIGFAHRRLSVIDLSDAAAQPMSNDDETLWITFNGEIYNHAELRSELESTGRYRWKTDHSDTEVLLHAFAEWGIECLKRLRGMFAFALWDARSRELWLVRDRLGIKPLYYSVHDRRISFASEVKALLADPRQRRAVHHEAFYHYLSFLTTPAPQTLFDGIRKLPNASWMRIDGRGRVTEQRYWDVWDHTAPLTGLSDDEIAARVLDELATAVQLHKVSDVPVGVFLSGGIDSSTNAALFSRGDTAAVKTFSVGYDRTYKSYDDELPYARRMAETVGAEHHEMRLSERYLLDFLPEMVRLQDEPIADPVCMPLYFVSKLAREHGVKVCQLGEGADELFCGYPRWITLSHLERWNALPVPGGLKRLGLIALRLAGREHGFAYERLRRGTAHEPAFWSGAEAFTETEKRSLLAPRLAQELRDLSSWDALRSTYQRFNANAWERSPLNWMTYSDMNLRLPELLLMRVDKMSMGVSLEARVPFLDHRFVELAMSIPSAAKIRGGELKHVLKRAVRGIVPDDLIRRKKQGFGIPIHEWFLGALGAEARATIRRFCAKTDFFAPAAIERLLVRGTPHQIWYLLNFALWWEAYVAG